MEQRRVVAVGGGSVLEAENRLMDEFVLSLARSGRPRVCFIPTASGDAERAVASFYRGFSELDCRPTDLQLFWRRVPDLRGAILAQDVVVVGGGNTANLLAVWRTHGLDQVLVEAWHEGIVLCGASAGMNCWFEESVTDSFNLNVLAPLKDGLGLLPGSACPHYDAEEQRRPTFERLVASGELADGWAADNGAGLVFVGEELGEVVTFRPGACAYRVERSGEEVRESALPTRSLG